MITSHKPLVNMNSCLNMFTSWNFFFLPWHSLLILPRYYLFFVIFEHTGTSIFQNSRIQEQLQNETALNKQYTYALMGSLFLFSASNTNWLLRYFSSDLCSFSLEPPTWSFTAFISLLWFVVYVSRLFVYYSLFLCMRSYFLCIFLFFV